MRLLKPRQFFDPSCPSGGTWYSCGYGSMFVGCCRSEACSDDGCPTGNLEPASFNPSTYGEFPDQECSAGLWYTCSATDPPFLGCCKTNPCDAGSCPTDDLAAGFLSNDSAVAAAFSPTGGSLSTSTSIPTSTTTSASSTTPTSTPTLLSTGTSNATTKFTATPIPTVGPINPAKASHHIPVGAIVGSVIGGIIAVCLLGSLIKLYNNFSRTRALRQGGTHPEEFLQSPVAPGSADGPSKATSSPPPKYSTVTPLTPELAELAGSPGQKRHLAKPGTAIPPVELDTGNEATADNHHRWTQNTFRSEMTQFSGLGINYMPNSS